MPVDGPLKHNPFSSLRNAKAVSPAPAPATTPIPPAEQPLARLIVREEFDTAEASVIARIIGVPRERLGALGKQLREALSSVVAIEGRELLVMDGDCERVAAWLRDAGAQEVVTIKRLQTANPADAGAPGGTQRAQIRRGLRVAIVMKADQESGTLTEGVVRDILTSSSVHPRGIKVRLETGQVGRVRRVYFAICGPDPDRDSALRTRPRNSAR